MTRSEILAVARSQLEVKGVRAATPWVHQAHKLGVGVDCLGFFVTTAAECGSQEAVAVMNDPLFWSYGREPDPPALIRACDERMDRVAETLPADVVLMKVGGWPLHFGFIGDGDPATLIHASWPHKRVVEHRLDEGWRSRIVRAWRIRGIE